VTAPARGRPREFDTGVALEALRDAFHERGYHATSLSHLTEATGLHRGSLYAAFGDKHQMFLAALCMHVKHSEAALDATLAGAESPVAGIRQAMLEQAIRAADETAGGRGCLIANTTLELLPGDHEVAGLIARHQARTIGQYAAAIERGRQSGEVTSARASSELAHYLFTVIEGLWQLARTTPDKAVLTAVVETAVDTLHPQDR
jgi:TetR/AcrR family transcriptional regulator, transcriptional repressor for nem operon